MFPHLKIEFYSGRHQAGEGSPKDSQLDLETTIETYCMEDCPDQLEINDQMMVRQLEEILMDSFGLNAQVFRRSGNLWMQTTATDHWTLAVQERKGAASEYHFQQKYQQP